MAIDFMEHPDDDITPLPDAEWMIAIPHAELLPAIGQYVTHIETGETKVTCKCEWLETKGHFQKIAESLECPVHTKEGFLLGFFRWMFPDAEIAGPPAEAEPPALEDVLVEAPHFPAHINQDGSGVYPVSAMGKGMNGKPDPEPAEPGVCNCESYEPCNGECCGVGNCTCTPDLSAVLKERIRNSGFRDGS